MKKIGWIEISMEKIDLVHRRYFEMYSWSAEVSNINRECEESRLNDLACNARVNILALDNESR